jgi:hypothetical protein
MISLISNRLPSQARYKASDCRKPVSTGTTRNFAVISFLSFATQSARSGLMHCNKIREIQWDNIAIGRPDAGS